MTKDKVIEMVKKLLSRTKENGCTDGEAAVAAAKVQNLLAQYNLEATDLEEQPITCKKVSLETKGISRTQSLFTAALKEHFGVEVVCNVNKITREGFMEVIGEEVKVDVFIETFMFMYSTFKKNWTSLCRQLNESTRSKNIIKDNYTAGYLHGFTNELIKMESETALVVSRSEELNNYVEQQHYNEVEHKYQYNQNTEGYARGYMDGVEAQNSKDKVIE